MLLLNRCHRWFGSDSPAATRPLMQRLEERRLFSDSVHLWDGGTEQSAPGVTAAWYADGQAITGFDFNLTASRPSVELRLSGLPQHGAISYGYFGEAWTSQDVTVTMTGPAGNSSVTGGSGGIVAGSVAGAHQGPDLTVSFSTSGLSGTDFVYLYYGGVDVPPKPTVSLSLLQDGSEDPDAGAPSGGPKPVKFTISRSAVDWSEPYPGDLPIDFSVTDITTTMGFDFVLPQGFIVIPAGQPSAVLEVVTTNDELFEASESFRVTLDPSSRYTFSNAGVPPFADGTIADNERTDLALSGLSEVDEENPGAIFELGASTLATMALDVPEIEGGGQVTLSMPAGADKALVWESSTPGPAGTQLIGGDQTAPVTWAAGSEPQTLYVQAVGVTSALASIQFALTAQNSAGTLPASRATDTANGANEGAVLHVGGVDKTDKTTAVLVGQHINPQVVVSNPKQAAVIYKWVEPAGETFKSYDHAATANQLQQVPGDDLDDASLSFYYADSGQNPVSCTLTLGGKDYTVETTFSVLKPASSLSATKGEVRMGLAPQGGVPATFGLLGGQNSDHGMVFTVINVENVPGFAAGTWQFTQMIRKIGRTRTDTDDTRWKEMRNGLSALDGSFKYQPEDPWATGTGLHTTYDDVKTPTADRKLINLDEEFGMYVMYLPPGANSAWVPLRVMEWHYSGTAQLVNGAWDVVNPIVDFTPSTSTNIHPQWERVNLGAELWEQVLD